MNVSPAKENILKRIRKALSQSTPLPFPKSEGHESVYTPLQQEMEVEFAEQFSKLQGRFVFCINEQELAFQLSSLVKKRDWSKVYCPEPELVNPFRDQFEGRLNNCEGPGDSDVAITGCECLVARTGSIVMSSASASGRSSSVYAPIHICIARTNQLVYDMRDALARVKEKYRDNPPSLITFATGPSRTADIEKTLVVGVHGPREVFLFLVES